MAIVTRFNNKHGKFNNQLLAGNGRQLSPVFSISSVGKRDLFVSLTNNTFIHHVKDQQTKEIVDANDFSGATYRVVDFFGDDKLILTLGNGIEVKDKGFVVTISPSDIKFKGRFTHMFTVEIEGVEMHQSFRKDLLVI